MEKEKVLVVDDILMNRILLAEIVEQIGYKAVMAENGKVAIDILKKGGIKKVLMDVEMPVMNGIEATKKIKSTPEFWAVKIAGVTAHDPKSFFSDYKNVSFDAFITKPYTVKRVGEVLKGLAGTESAPAV